MATTIEPPSIQLPPHPNPRVWFLTSGTSPVAIALARQLLAHGDYVAAGARVEDLNGEDDRFDELKSLVAEAEEGQPSRFKVIQVDIRSIGQCQAAIAQILDAWERLDILLCCTSEAVVGTVEELAGSGATLNLVHDQFETNFFGPANIIKSTLPEFREQGAGHLLVLTGITGHIGTPGLGSYCASSWALEGFCDSLTYEVAPFNIKVTIVQPNMEVNVLTNKITFTPPMPWYSSQSHPAPSVRQILTNAIDVPDQSAQAPTRSGPSGRPKKTPTRTKNGKPAEADGTEASGASMAPDTSVTVYPWLPPSTRSSLVAETVHALAAIGGHENPPARHIVGHEGVASVKEKLKTVSEELEDFVDVSAAVDITQE